MNKYFNIQETRKKLEKDVEDAEERYFQARDAWKQSKYSIEQQEQINITSDLLDKAKNKLITFTHKNLKVGDGVTVITEKNNKYSYTVLNKNCKLLLLKKDLVVTDSYVDEDGYNVTNTHIVQDYFGPLLTVYWDKILKQYNRVYQKNVKVVKGRTEELSIEESQL